MEGVEKAVSPQLESELPREKSENAVLIPYIISIQKGENIVERIWSFSQTKTPDSVWIISAFGTISAAAGELRIIQLNGSNAFNEGRLSVLLVDKEGRLYGGEVAGALIAGGPTEIIIATYRPHKVAEAEVEVEDVVIDLTN